MPRKSSKRAVGLVVVSLSGTGQFRSNDPMRKSAEALKLIQPLKFACPAWSRHLSDAFDWRYHGMAARQWCTMRLLFVADLHYSLKQFDWLLAQAGDFELVIIGGDLLDLASALDADVQIAIMEKYIDLIRQKTTLVVSSGNHDGDSRNEADESIAAWVRDAKDDRLFVDGDSFDFGSDTRITVCPWWDGELSRDELEALLVYESAKLQGRRWIWIHHAPPQGARTSWTGRKFIGDEALRTWIDRFQPAMVLSGHIHNSPFYAEGSWIDRIGNTWVFNPGRQLGSQPATIIFDLVNLTAEWSSQEGHAFQELRLAES